MDVTSFYFIKAFTNLGVNVASNGSVVAEWISGAALRQHNVK